MEQVLFMKQETSIGTTKVLVMVATTVQPTSTEVVQQMSQIFLKSLVHGAHALDVQQILMAMVK